MEKKSMAEQAYALIKEKILFGGLQFGDELDQKALAKTLGFNSVTPIREALILLQKDHFVDILPRKGVRVSEISITDVIENYQVREIIEPVVFSATALDVPGDVVSRYIEYYSNLASAAEKFDYKQYLISDMEFHLALLQPLNNGLVMSLLQNIYEQDARYRLASMLKRSSSEMLEEHLNILRALQDRDANAAVEALKTHLYNSKQAFFTGGYQFL